MNSHLGQLYMRQEEYLNALIELEKAIYHLKKCFEVCETRAYKGITIFHIDELQVVLNKEFNIAKQIYAELVLKIKLEGGNPIYDWETYKNLHRS